MRIFSFASVVLLLAAPALAHVGVTPRESKLGASETYTLRVPSEGGRTTTSVTLDVPDGVTITSVLAPEGTTHDEEREAVRIVSVTWTIEINADASAELSFVAENPPEGVAIAWKVHQRYSDGMVSDWIGPAGSRAPSPVTKLVAADADAE